MMAKEKGIVHSVALAMLCHLIHSTIEKEKKCVEIQ
jgi:hypothetical protein